MSKKRKKYDSTFKLEAIRLVNEEGRKVSEVERNLDISRGTLVRWIREKKADPEEAFPGKGRLKAKDEEIHMLKQEVKKVQEERDIIKKALVYFAEDQK
ncbi:MAG: transposase [Thermodesulfobacteriota bacterium]|nr:transposase [Thermodesulfobacteriota bacterium]